MSQELEPTPQGQAFYEELLWVHSMIRRDLEVVQRPRARSRLLLRGASDSASAGLLGELADHLLAHLELEEREVAPTLKAMTVL
jgi:hypothetical protein